MDLKTFLDWLPFALATGSAIGAAARARTSWAMVGCAIMASGLAAQVWVPDHAAEIVFAAWLVLFGVPLVLARLLLLAATRQDFGRARWLSLGIALLHPAGASVAQATLFQGLALMRRGRWDLAEPKLRAVAGRPQYPISQLSALAFLCHWSGDWRDVVDVPEAPGGEPMRTVVRVRAMGETGRLGDMLRLFADGQSKYPELTAWREAGLSVLAFGGRPDATAAYCRIVMARLPAKTAAFWLAIARMAAGGAEMTAGRAEMERLSKSDEPDISRPAARRLAEPPADASQMSEQSRVTLQRAEDELVGKASNQRRSRRRLPATAALIWFNILVFIIEGAKGGAQNIATLYVLGGIYPPAVIEGGQWWRLVTATFLHGGPLHLGINLAGLTFLGWLAEPIFGWKRFLAIYAATGVGSMAGVVALTQFGWSDPHQVLVGASGALMGLAGALVALLFTQWLVTRSATLGRWAVAAVLLIMLEGGIDLTMPHISLASHAVGLLLGVLVGFLPWVWRSPMLPVSLRAVAPEVALSRRDFAILGCIGVLIVAAVRVRR